MICPYCKKEFSDSVCRIHVGICSKNPKNKEVKEVKETPKKKGK